MLKPLKFANAVALVSIVLQILYYLAYVRMGQDYIGSVLLEILVVTAVAWVSTFSTIWLYNRFCDNC